jgi:hypothetical protein
MHKTTYAVLVVFAFAIGLTATIAASRLAAPPAAEQRPGLEQPTKAPSGAPERAPVPTQEC